MNDLHISTLIHWFTLNNTTDSFNVPLLRRKVSPNPPNKHHPHQEKKHQIPKFRAKIWSISINSPVIPIVQYIPTAKKQTTKVLKISKKTQQIHHIIRQVRQVAPRHVGRRFAQRRVREMRRALRAAAELREVHGAQQALRFAADVDGHLGTHQGGQNGRFFVGLVCFCCRKSHRNHGIHRKTIGKP